MAPRGETVFAAPLHDTGASAPAAAGELQLRVSDVSWIEVRDARGRVLLSRSVQAGEAVGLDGAAPLRLVIGNAPATELSYRGRRIDLRAHTRDTVARLELPLAAPQ